MYSNIFHIMLYFFGKSINSDWLPLFTCQDNGDHLIPDSVLEKHANTSVPFSEYDGGGRAPRAGL